MNYLGLQIIVTLFVVLVVYRLSNRFKDAVLKTSEFIGWLILWLAVLVVFWVPQTTSYLARLLGIGRGVDLALYVSVLILFYLIFKIYLKLDKQQKEITYLVRQQAINEKLKEEDEKSRNSYT